MAHKSITGSLELGKEIKQKRTELGLTIEEAALKAGIGTKTWSRYESGESIRSDKCIGICKVLGWRSLPTVDNANDDRIKISDYKNHKYWSHFIEKNFGESAAFSFATGSELLLDYINEDMQSLSSMPRGSHLGQLPYSMIASDLPEQFLMRYDYEFLFELRASVQNLCRAAHNGSFSAHSVIEELAIYLIVNSATLLQEQIDDMTDEDLTEWIYDLFEDSDICMFLYETWYIEKESIYHFDHWNKRIFFCDR